MGALCQAEVHGTSLSLLFYFCLQYWVWNLFLLRSVGMITKAKIKYISKHNPAYSNCKLKLLSCREEILINSSVILIKICCKKIKAAIMLYEKVMKVQGQHKHRDKACIFQKASLVPGEVMLFFPKSPVEIFTDAEATELSNVNWLYLFIYWFLTILLLLFWSCWYWRDVWSWQHQSVFLNNLTIYNLNYIN